MSSWLWFGTRVVDTGGWCDGFYDGVYEGGTRAVRGWYGEGGKRWYEDGTRVVRGRYEGRYSQALALPRVEQVSDRVKLALQPKDVTQTCHRIAGTNQHAADIATVTTRKNKNKNQKLACVERSGAEKHAKIGLKIAPADPRFFLPERQPKRSADRSPAVISAHLARKGLCFVPHQLVKPY